MTITAEQAWHWFVTNTSSDDHMFASMSGVIEQAVKHSGVSEEQMRGYSRKPKIVRARWYAMGLCRAYGYSLPQIGRFFNRDHTTVLHAIRKIEGKA